MPTDYLKEQLADYARRVEKAERRIGTLTIEIENLKSERARFIRMRKNHLESIKTLEYQLESRDD